MNYIICLREIFNRQIFSTRIKKLTDKMCTLQCVLISLEKSKTKKYKPINNKETIAFPENIFNDIPFWFLNTFKIRNIDTL